MRLGDSEGCSESETLPAIDRHSLSGGAHLGTVGKAGVPTAPTLRSEVHEVPDRSEQIDATLLNIGRHPGMR